MMTSVDVIEDIIEVEDKKRGGFYRILLLNQEAYTIMGIELSILL